MKKTIRVFALILAVLMTVAVFASCGASNNTKEETKADTGKVLKIGVIQYLSHPSLDNCYEGIKAGLEESGLNYEIDFQVGSSSQPDEDCANFAKNMVSSGVDMIIAIATPAAKSAFAATDETDIPVVFCAVSDPEAAELVQSNDKPGFNCTGTSDVLDLNAQVDLIQAMQPDVKSIGILYTTSEDNSLSNLETFKKICEERNLTVEATGVQGSSDIPAAAEELAAKVDCINNFTDNNVVNNLSVVLSAAEKNNIPVYGSEEEQVKNGCLASVSIDYVALGKVTGQMAAEILNGADAKTMAVKTISDATPVVNTDVLSALGITMPDAFKDATTVTTNA